MNDQTKTNKSGQPRQMTEQEELQWKRDAFETAQKFLVEKGLFPESYSDEECYFLVPLLSVWKFKCQNGKRYWVIAGRLPTDVIAATTAQTPRDAVRYFSYQWQLKADEIMSTGTRDQTQLNFANLLVNRAHGLYEIAEKQELWANVPA
ncbi:DUF4826 family protein [Pseudoalteromonas xiamenensis]|uniref:DUF4826 family protein n=1 Tax=Pseudoalteromonas xiamenensis TaxID=882626 RepID=A0A975HL55_9GAMM|nr:DUF4826 family protein [Pseudoalteromonas xiamenensis]QTH71738.1 DUF4826 family protein [Pseudoalteromonas xiamenensis]